jgi:lipoprotein-anchoring transpeptidase ErfK/SrfK
MWLYNLLHGNHIRLAIGAARRPQPEQVSVLPHFGARRARHSFGFCIAMGRPVMSRLCRATAIAAAMVIASASAAGPASAQLFDFGLSNVLWDWGGGNTVNDSGRQVVRFDQQFQPGTIVVSFGDRRLYFITEPGEAISYPVAIPRDEDRWEGTTTVSNKRVNPSWTPTPTMIAENPRLPRWVPGGHPMNPLGVRALYLGNSMYRIHGTDAPWTIGTAVSKGCIRMYNKDVLDLYPRVNSGATVVVTWQRFRTSASPEFVSAPRTNGPRLRPIDRSDLPPLR